MSSVNVSEKHSPTLTYAQEFKKYTKLFNFSLKVIFK